MPFTIVRTLISALQMQRPLAVAAGMRVCPKGPQPIDLLLVFPSLPQYDWVRSIQSLATASDPSTDGVSGSDRSKPEAS